MVRIYRRDIIFIERAYIIVRAYKLEIGFY